MNDLTEQDVELLCDALDAWENRGAAGDIMGKMLTMALVPEDKRDEFEAEQAAKEAGRKEEQRREKERVVLLKAKLIGIVNKIEAASVASAIGG